MKPLGRLLTTLGFLLALPLHADAPGLPGVCAVPGQRVPVSPSAGHHDGVAAGTDAASPQVGNPPPAGGPPTSEATATAGFVQGSPRWHDPAGRSAATASPPSRIAPRSAATTGDRRAGIRPQGNPGTGARSVRLVAPGWTAGETNELVVEIDALGDEHLLSFSVEFDPGLLRYLGVVPGQSVPGGSLLVNPASAAAGRLGAGLLLPPELNLDPGTLELLRLRFAVPGLAEGRTTQIVFGDRPTVRDTTGIDGLPLATDYVGLTLTVGAPPTLRLSPVVRNQDRIEFRTEGVTNRPVIIQASTDLGGWQNILTNTAGAGPVVLPWSAADGLHSFRALTP